VASISSATESSGSGGWNTVKQTMRGALRGDVGDIATVAGIAGVATGALPVSTGLAVVAGGELLGTVVDVFA
jgi:type IV secretory pathway VirB2 component (pilin)